MICVIPARGGSKGIPRKNIRAFNGKPLIAWSIESALESDQFRRVIVSTDCKEIAEIARQYGAETPFIRPPNLANDDVHSVHVVLHTLDWLKSHENFEPDAVMMLLPTSPLRRAEDIRKSVALQLKSNAPAVISVQRLGKYLTNLRYIEQDQLIRVSHNENPNEQRQNLDELYGVNGSIFLADTCALLEQKTFHVEGAVGLVMSYLSSVDINTIEDFELATVISQKFEPWKSNHKDAR
jgi:CMP-N-acetylneuraminic acid synthetase